MSGLFRFAGWATATFALSWLVAGPWQRGVASVAGAIVAGPGRHVEWGDLQVFFPFDLSVYLALCLSSSWVDWRARLRAGVVGAFALVGVEIVTLVAVMEVMLAAAGLPADRAEAVQRLVVGVIRLTGLAAAGAIWTYALGWQRLPELARRLERGVKRTQRR
jgi:hypothetical protein